MKKISPFPVTEENFPQCWEYVDRCRRAARKKAAIAKFGCFWGNLMFLLALVFFACGILHDRVEHPFREFFENFPIYDLWEQTTAHVLIPGNDLTSDILRLLLAAYGLGIAVFLAIAVIVLIVYHPFRKIMPEGLYPEQTAQLAAQAQEARTASYSTRISSSIAASILAIVTIFFILSAYIIYSMDAAGITAMLSTFPTSNYQTNCIIYVLFLYIIIDILSAPLLLITRPVYRYDFPYDHMIQAERAVILAKEMYQNLSAEELTVLCKEHSAKIREEALEFEKDAAYKKAKQLLLEAAICGDVPAMEHYARLCLLSRMNDSAGYWLKKAIASGEATRDAEKMQLRLRLGLRPNVGYLQHDKPPLTTGQKILRAVGTALSVLWRILILAVFAATVWLCVKLFQAGGDLYIFADYSKAITEFFAKFTFLQ